MSDERLGRPIYINGINGSTGEPLLPQIPTESAEKRVMTWQDLLNHMTGDEGDYFQLMKKRAKRRGEDMGTIAGVDARKLEKAGWGIIYAKGITDEVKEALSPLVNWRRGQANKEKELFQAYEFKPKYADPQSGFRFFMSDHKTAPRDDAKPEQMPYYLLLVGDPEEIPYIFQYALDVNRAVGRIYFDTVEEYGNYAQSVVSAEEGSVRLPRRAAFWGVKNENDEATKLSMEHLIKPLHKHFEQKLSDRWNLDNYLAEQASTAQLRAILGGDKDQAPAFLLTGSHGIGFNLDDKRLLAHQGALIGSDWIREPGSISEEMYVAGSHLDSSAQLHGLIAFFFACYGAGTPMHDDFMGKVQGTTRQIAPRPILAKLPQRMLSHPRGGALAVIGHVDRAWTFSFMEDSSVTESSYLSFESTLTELFQGVPIGHAFDYFNRKHASSSVGLVTLLDEKRNGEDVDDFDLIDVWISNHDARDYVILGDPAVRLCVDLEGEQLVESTLSLSEIDLEHYQPTTESAATTEADTDENIETVAEADPSELRQGRVTGDDFKGQIETPSSPKALANMKLGVRYDWREYISGQDRYVANWAVRGKSGRKELVTIKANETTKELLDNINLRTEQPVNVDNLKRGSYGIISAQDMSFMDSGLGATIQEAIDKFSEQISRSMRNISTLEVLTYVSDEDLKNVYDADNKTFREQAQLKAVTLLSLDGDVKSMVPTRQINVTAGDKMAVTERIDTELLDIHKEMVALAQENQARFFKNVLEIAAALINMSQS